MRPAKPYLVIPALGPDPNQSYISKQPDELMALAAKVMVEEDNNWPSPKKLDSNQIHEYQDVSGFEIDGAENILRHPGALKYTPLLPGQIRLFRLEPRGVLSNQDPNHIVRGVLEHHHLSDHPQFNSLSYCWGSDANRRPISVNGHIIAIHSNLEAALRQIQSYRGEMLIWADRLCINQNDDDEKTVQVQLMGHIYAEASLVFTWLGEAADDSDLIIDHFQMLGDDIYPGHRGYLATEAQLDRIILAYKTSESREALSNAFAHLCLRPYWQRLWVIQEFALAAEVVVVCGDRQVSFSQLAKGLYFVLFPRYYFDLMVSLDAKDERMEVIEAVVGTYSSATPSFMQGVFTMRTRHEDMECRKEDDLVRVLTTSLVLEIDYNHPKSTDPRDRIFATLGLANNANKFPMLPDYQHDWQFVYTTFAKTLLRQGHIDILSFCQFTERNPLLLEGESLPSWVPDWNLKIKYPCVSAWWNSYFMASLDYSERQNVLIDDVRNQVGLVGVNVDTIKSIGSVWDPNWLAPLDIDATKRYISEVSEFCKSSPHPSIVDSQLEQAIGRVCIADKTCCDGNKTWWEDETLYPNGYCQCFDDTVTAFEENRLPTGSLYYQHLKFLHSRRPFISETGLVGLAPSNVEVGDQICIFAGGKTPYTVSKPVNGVSRLKGETFVHGIMYGEFVADCTDSDICWIVLS